MARKNDQEIEAIKERSVSYYIGGVTTPTQLMHLAKIDFKTAVKYLDLAKTRVNEIVKNTDRETILKREIVSLDRLEEIAWENIDFANNVNHLAGLINAIIKIKERKFELLDLKSIIYKVIKDSSEIKEDKQAMDFQSHDWFILTLKAQAILDTNGEYQRGEIDRYGEQIKKEAKGV